MRNILEFLYKSTLALHLYFMEVFIRFDSIRIIHTILYDQYHIDNMSMLLSSLTTIYGNAFHRYVIKSKF